MTSKLLSILLIIILPITSTSMMMSSARLAGQRVVVTGAGRGIGRALALICSREGANVAVLVRIVSHHVVHMMCQVVQVLMTTAYILFHAKLIDSYAHNKHHSQEHSRN